MKRFALTDLPTKYHDSIIAQCAPRDSRQAPLLESDMRPRALGAGEAKGGDTGRFLIRVTAFRVRLLDEDNLCEKYHVDCCRYAGLIPDDNPGQTKIETGQIKVAKKDQERVLIEIFYP